MVEWFSSQVMIVAYGGIVFSSSDDSGLLWYCVFSSSDDSGLLWYCVSPQVMNVAYGGIVFLLKWW